MDTVIPALLLPYHGNLSQPGWATLAVHGVRCSPLQHPSLVNAISSVLGLKVLN